MENKYDISQSNGYFIVTVDGKFYCSCDSRKEAQEEINRLKQHISC